MNKLDPSVKTIWSLSILFRFSIFAVIFLVAEFLFIEPNFDWFLPLGVTSGIIFLFGLILAILWPTLEYKHWSFDVKENELIIIRGVFTRIRTTAPLIRIQHLDVQESVFERMFGLASLVIYTAGTRGADLVIPGLPPDYAESLRDALKNFSPEDAV